MSGNETTGDHLPINYWSLELIDPKLAYLVLKPFLYTSVDALSPLISATVNVATHETCKMQPKPMVYYSSSIQA